ncbi:hypothetical protein B0H10DRAFT_2183661 [Mycena sp. CBHHK59/15]|nr:hypothetical protein B0H10DRAFT_2183661 [Mycena sp. CBHHK59/15]
MATTSSPHGTQKPKTLGPTYNPNPPQCCGGLDPNRAGTAGRDEVGGRGERRRRRCKLANGCGEPLTRAEKSRGVDGGDSERKGDVGRVNVSSPQSNGAGAGLTSTGAAIVMVTASACAETTDRERGKGGRLPAHVKAPYPLLLQLLRNADEGDNIRSGDLQVPLDARGLQVIEAAGAERGEDGRGDVTQNSGRIHDGKRRDNTTRHGSSSRGSTGPRVTEVVQNADGWFVGGRARVPAKHNQTPYHTGHGVAYPHVDVEISRPPKAERQNRIQWGRNNLKFSRRKSASLAVGWRLLVI